MKRVVKFLERLKFSADAILTSRSARLANGRDRGQAPRDRIKNRGRLAHGFNVERLRRLLGKADADCVMVVGHEPAFSEVIKELTGGEVKLSKAGVALLEVNRGCTSGKLLWLFPPKIAKAAL